MLLNLLAHTTDCHQHLDVYCFRPLKVAWDKAITKRNTENLARRFNKPEFRKLTREIWDDYYLNKISRVPFAKQDCALLTGIFIQKISSMTI